MAKSKKAGLFFCACAVGAVVAAEWAGGDVWRFAGPFALLSFAMQLRTPNRKASDGESRTSIR